MRAFALQSKHELPDRAGPWYWTIDEDWTRDHHAAIQFLSRPEASRALYQQFAHVRHQLVIAEVTVPGPHSNLQTPLQEASLRLNKSIEQIRKSMLRVATGLYRTPEGMLIADVAEIAVLQGLEPTCENQMKLARQMSQHATRSGKPSIITSTLGPVIATTPMPNLERCVECGAALDELTSCRGSRPRPGHFSVCSTCGHLSILDERLCHREPDENDLAELHRDQRAWELMTRMQQAVRAQGRAG